MASKFLVKFKIRQRRRLSRSRRQRGCTEIALCNCSAILCNWQKLSATECKHQFFCATLPRQNGFLGKATEVRGKCTRKTLKQKSKVEFHKTLSDSSDDEILETDDPLLSKLLQRIDRMNEKISKTSEDPTSAHSPATRNHTGDGGHTYTGRTGYTHRGSRREHRRAAHHHALTARRRPRPPQGPTHRHRKRTKARPQQPGLGTGTPRGHRTEAQAPREGNPTNTYPTHQPKRHAQAPTARTERATHT